TMNICLNIVKSPPGKRCPLPEPRQILLPGNAPGPDPRSAQRPPPSHRPVGGGWPQRWQTGTPGQAPCL
uniref:Uncharacterized protein n=1 Tax=Xiphophorus maculatus TaxID=8083 RepID=A0A3B5REH9_XIPMA